jgi:hypothetical protein
MHRKKRNLMVVGGHAENEVDLTFPEGHRVRTPGVIVSKFFFGFIGESED